MMISSFRENWSCQKTFCFAFFRLSVSFWIWLIVWIENVKHQQPATSNPKAKIEALIHHKIIKATCSDAYEMWNKVTVCQMWIFIKSHHQAKYNIKWIVYSWEIFIIQWMLHAKTLIYEKWKWENIKQMYFRLVQSPK